MDVLMTSYDDRLIVIKKDDLTKILSDGQMVLSTKGSEIRTTGKNKKKVFTPIYLRNTLISLGVFIDDDDVCSINKKNLNVIGFIQGRGTPDVTRYKITNCFFVENKEHKLIDCNEHWKFNFSDILQCKSGISIHITLSRNKDDIKKELDY